jgi:DNA processing protein
MKDQTSKTGARDVRLLPERDRVPGRVIETSDPEWPSDLNELGPHDPPQRLYACGEIIPVGTSVAVVGARHATAAGIEVAETLARGLAEAGCTVVSGLAVGIDAAAHRAALRAGGHTVAVLGCGLDIDYPGRNRGLRKQIAERGTVVSEYPHGTPPHAWHFPARNRIIVGLSSAVIVVEGTIKSGALVTARLALDANRGVFAVPGSVRNAMATGPNELIRTGQAGLVTSVEHIFEELAPNLVWRDSVDPIRPPGPAVTDEELDVLAILDDQPLTTDRVAAHVGISSGKAALILSRLEIRALARRGYMGYSIAAAGARAREAAFSNNT